MTSANARAILMVANVGTNGGILSLVTHRPLKRPMIAAAARPTAAAPAVGQPAAISAAVVTAVMPQTLPTDKSIPPVIITIASPMTTMPMNEKLRESLIRLSVVRNVGAANASNADMIASAIKIPASRERTRRERRVANCALRGTATSGFGEIRLRLTFSGKASCPKIPSAGERSLLHRRESALRSHVRRANFAPGRQAKLSRS